MAFALRAELRLEPADERQVVFATRAAKIKVIFRNPSAESHKSTLRYRIFQATSITAMPVGSEQVWKELEVLGGQTVLETVEVTLPAVKVATPFLARWRDDAGHVLGHTTILACPGDQLARFGTDGVGSAIGVFDRRGKLFPVLSRAGLPCERLETLEQLSNFSGRLTIVVMDAEDEMLQRELREKLARLAAAGRVLLSLRPPSAREDPGDRTVGVVRLGTGVLVTAGLDDIRGLETSAAAQLQLVRFCEIAFKPERLISATVP